MEGASPELLRTLLSAYEIETANRGGPVATILAKGRTEAEIRERLASVGLTAPEELIVWWSWHGGVKSGLRPQSRWDQLPVDKALTFFQLWPKGFTEATWNPTWIRIAGSDGGGGLAASCDPGRAAPLVRMTDPVDLTTQGAGVPYQIVSLCTIVTWWLHGLVRGWITWNPELQFWETDLDAYPLEWKLTQVL